MTDRDLKRDLLREALATERSLVLSLGGYALQYAGGTLVLHEKVPVPRFNFVEIERLSVERQAGFFERALDQYFQRALRPSFRVPIPVAPYLDRTLRGLGFQPRRAPLTLVGRTRERAMAVQRSEGIRHGREVRTEVLVPFWARPRETPELSSALEILRHHPNPGETVVPVLATEGGGAVGAGLAYSRGSGTFVFGVATAPHARGRGVATSIVRWILAHPPADRAPFTAVLSDDARLTGKLRRLGFEAGGRWKVYELAADAELSLPPVAPSAGPLWRPPRTP